MQNNEISSNGNIESKQKTNEPVEDLHYARLTKEQTTEKQAILQQIFEKYFPDIKEKVYFKDGYIFFPEFNKRQVNYRDFREEYDRVAKPVYFQFPDHFNEQVKEAINILSQEYKIHLMPKCEYTTFVIKQLFSTIQSDPELKSLISQIKVINDDKKERKEVLPSIVIYTQLGKGNAQIALDKILNYFSKLNNIGLDRTPRYNQKVNSLIYYAQSGGDWKNTYIGALLAIGAPISKSIFDENLVHFKGDYRLKIPL